MGDDRRLGTLMASRVTLRAGDREFTVELRSGEVLVNGAAVTAPHRAYAVADRDRRLVFLDGEVYEFVVQRPGHTRAASHHSSLSAPMPATVIRINVAPGASVRKGETLLVVEAMKMELPIRAPADGTVTAVSCKQGDLVQPGVALVELED